MPLSFAYPRDLSLKSGDSARFYCQAIAFNYLQSLNWYYLNNTNPMDIDIQTVDLSKFKKMKSVRLYLCYIFRSIFFLILIIII